MIKNGSYHQHAGRYELWRNAVGATISASAFVRRSGAFLRIARFRHRTQRNSAPGATANSSSPAVPNVLVTVEYRSSRQLTCMSLSTNLVPSSNSWHRNVSMVVSEIDA